MKNTVVVSFGGSGMTCLMSSVSMQTFPPFAMVNSKVMTSFPFLPVAWTPSITSCSLRGSSASNSPSRTSFNVSTNALISLNLLDPNLVNRLD